MHVVILGGTSGIGLATATELAGDGVRVTVTGRDPDKVGKVNALAAGIRAVSVDGSREEEVAEFFAGVGEFEHLVLAFGPGPVGLRGPIRQLELADIRSGFDGKLFGYLAAIRHARVTGSVTMISAATARAAMPGTVAVAAVNGAIERMVSPLAADLAPVRVNVVSPGVVDTPWWSFLPQEEKEQYFALAAETLPVARVGRPEEVAQAVRYLLDATYVTGSVLPVDGGFTVA